MGAYVRDFVDPLEGLMMQLGELDGFAQTVPPLIEDHWQRLWDEVMSQPGDPDEDPVDAYSRAAGAGTGGGFADFGRTVYVASLVLGFEAFKDYLGLNLARRERGGPRWGRTTVRDELEVELTGLRVPKLIGRYNASGIQLAEVEGWSTVEEIQFTRNALVHNHGRYTTAYFNTVKHPRYPTKDDISGMEYANLLSDDERQEWLVDSADIPLDLAYVSRSLKTLGSFAKSVDAS